jgi:hypothetical protein
MSTPNLLCHTIDLNGFLGGLVKGFVLDVSEGEHRHRL